MDRRQSSRQRFADYSEQLQRRLRSGTAHKGALAPEKVGLEGRSRRSRARTSVELVREFWRLARAERSWLLISLGTLTVATILALVPPAATKFVIDSVLGDEPLPAWLAEVFPATRWDLLVAIVVTVFTVSAVKIVLHIWGRWLATRSTKRLQLSLRRQVFAHAVRLPLPKVHDLRSGGVASILREDAGSVAELIFGMLYNPWRAIVQLIGSLCVLAWVDWRLLLGAIAILPVIFATHRTWIARIRPRWRDIRFRREQIDAHATESFSGIRVVRGFSRASAETGRFMLGNNLMARQELAAWWWTRGIEILWEAMIPLASAALLMYGGWQVLQGTLTVGDLMMFLAYLLMLLEPMAVLAQSATQLQNSLSALDRVLDLLGEDPEMADSPGDRRVQRETAGGHVEVQNVSFRYSDDAEFALENISFEAAAGETVALVGPSGAGKTTLCNLIARFYDPQQGRILLDGLDLRELNVESYRSLLGIVEQDVFLFDGSVGENIAYANYAASEEDVKWAADMANAAGFIEQLPNRYDTLIGERGVKLSGGQRQRIAIARAILADPAILILDEATSNLDTESERLIQQSLARLMQDRTCFAIAHRLSTIRHADLILVMENGRIIERGGHEELMERGGRYQEMVEAQLLMDIPAAIG